MRKIHLFFALSLLLVTSANAQLTKVFETKLQAVPGITMENYGENFIQAGNKMFEVIELSDGKALIAKSYKDAGANFEKAFSACIDESGEFLVACDDEKSVSCINVKTGSKIWENQTFIELGSDKTAGSLTCKNGVVIVSDKKAKNNYTITCLDSKSGKELWKIENEPEKIASSDVYIHANFVRTTYYSKKSDKTYLKLYNIKTGKLELSSEMEGSPIYTLNVDEDYVFVHHRVSDKKSFLSAIDLQAKKVMWKSAASNVSPNLPMVMNTDVIRYYATIQAFEGKVVLITEGVEAFDIATGKSIYNLPFVPYYKWGVGHYIDAIFQPVVTDKGILLADANEGDIYIRYYDRNNGKLLWSSEKQKNKKVSPAAYVLDNKAIVQFGGVCVFEVMNRSEIGKYLDPYAVTAFDLSSGKVSWNVDSKADIYTTEIVKNNLLLVGKKELQMIDPKTGSISKTEKNPFDESYFLTNVGLSKTTFRKNAEIDFENRVVIRIKDNKLIKSKF